MQVKIRSPGALALLAVSAALALSGGAAAPARAAGVCTGANIFGQGSTAQNNAEQVWTGAVAGLGFNANANGCPGGRPTATYVQSNSYDCQDNQWGGARLNAAVDFCGTDAPPTATELGAINGNLGGANALTIPVAQAAIAILVNPPSGCAISTITPADLEAVFRGNITTWAGIGTASGCGTTRITRVVRDDKSGTTYQFKNYLFTQNRNPVQPCPGAASSTWADLQPPPGNQVWPLCGILTRSQTGCPFACRAGGVGGLDEALTVGSTIGSIGYAALPDARAVYGSGWVPDMKWIRIRTTVRVSVDPSTNGLSNVTANSNCTTAMNSYGVALPAATASWSSVYLANPGTGYPICNLSSILAASDYTGGWGAVFGPPIGQTVCDYLRYINLTRGGVADALTNTYDYQVLPPDVQAAALTGIGLMLARRC